MSRAAILFGPRELSVEDVVLDDPGEFEVLVRVAGSGLCHSDYHFVDGTLTGRYPRLLGHEVSGVVERVGINVSTVSQGDHVVACFAASCDSCQICRAGQPHLCPNRTKYWSRSSDQRPRITVSGQAVDQGSGIGGLADLALVHEKLLVKIRNDMPLVPAAILGCAVLTGTGAVFRSAKVERGSQVAVIGCGAIGISIIQAARIAGCSRIFAVDVVAAKLEQASTFGATDLTDASVVDPIASILDQTDGAGVNFSFEAIGHPATVNQAFGMLGIGGTAIIVGIFSPDAVVELHPRDYVNGEKSIRGSYLGSSNFRTEIPRLVDLYLSGTLLLDEMLSPRISLDDVSSGFEAMIGGRGLRPIVDFEIS